MSRRIRSFQLFCELPHEEKGIKETLVSAIVSVTKDAMLKLETERVDA